MTAAVRSLRRIATALLSTMLLVCPARATVSEGPAVEILEPAGDFKVHRFQAVPVRVRVTATEARVDRWVLRVHDGAGESRELAHGVGATAPIEAAVLEAAQFNPGTHYILTLEADDVEDNLSSAIRHFVVPDPQYTVVPLESNLSRPFTPGISVDARGQLVHTVEAPYPWRVTLRDLVNGERRTFIADIGSSEGHQLTRDGKRLFFRGGFPRVAGVPYDLGFVDLATEEPTGIGSNSTALFSTTSTGDRVAFQSVWDVAAGGNPSRTLQYFWYDEATGITRQITRDPEGIDSRGGCPFLVGTKPVIAGDGSAVVFIMSATLGLADSDPAVGCRVFRHDVGDGSTRHVLVFPRGMQVDLPSLSHDGRWLGITTTRLGSNGTLNSFPALVDIESGTLVDPLTGSDDFAGFDSVVSADGSLVVVSSQADLDPRVGNSDHNMEIFVWDRRSGRFMQVTQTTGGVEPSGGGCAAYRPRLSDAASVIVFRSKPVAGECLGGRSQRNEADGFAFRRVVAVRKRLGNHDPQLQSVSNVRMTAGDPLRLEPAAADPDGDPITFFAQVAGGLDLPPGATLEEHGNGAATLAWDTTADVSGFYPMRAAVFDYSGGESIVDFSIAVCRRIVPAARFESVIDAIFDVTLPAACHDVYPDLNRDGTVTAADLAVAE